MMMDSRADALVGLVCGLSESTSRWTSQNPVGKCKGPFLTPLKIYLDA